MSRANRVVLMICHSGNERLGDHIKRQLADYLGQMNDTGEVAFLRIMNQESLYRIVAEGGRGGAD